MHSDSATPGSRVAGTPLEAAAAVFDALNRRDWTAAAELMDRDDVDAWFRGLLDAHAGEATQQPSMGDLLAHMWVDGLDQLLSATELNTGVARDFAGISSRAELARLTPVEALARFLQARDPDWRFSTYVQLLAPSRRPDCPEPHVRHRTVAQLVHEDDSSAAVAYTRTWSDRTDDASEAESHVARLRCGPLGWRMRLAGELLEDASFTILAEAASA
jgi:hypothetical protein